MAIKCTEIDIPARKERVYIGPSGNNYKTYGELVKMELGRIMRSHRYAPEFDYDDMELISQMVIGSLDAILELRLEDGN